MVYSRDRRFVFVHVPRTGGTSITAALMQSVPDAIDDGRLTHQGIWGITQLLPEVREYASFGFVRNPYCRMLSWYGAHVGIKPPDAGTRAEFAAFLRALNMKYLRPAASFLFSVHRAHVSWVGRYERYADDFADFCGRLGIVCPVLPHEHDSRRRHHYSEYYTDQSRDFVLRMSGDDFDRFGYATEFD